MCSKIIKHNNNNDNKHLWIEDFAHSVQLMISTCWSLSLSKIWFEYQLLCL